MAKKSYILCRNDFDQSYYLRLELDSELYISLDPDSGLTSGQKERLRAYFSSDPNKLSRLEGVINIKRERDDYDGYDELKHDYVDIYNQNCPREHYWSKYDELNDSLVSALDEASQLEDYFQNGIIKAIASLDSEYDDVSIENIKRLIKEDKNKVLSSGKLFALYLCPVCKKYSILKRPNNTCPECGQKLVNSVVEGSLKECSSRLEAINNGQEEKPKEEKAAFYFQGRRYLSNDLEDVEKLHQAVLDNHSPETFLLKNELDMISFRSEFREFMEHTSYRDVIDNFYQFNSDIESTFQEYLLSFKKSCSSLRFAPYVFYNGKMIKEINEVLQLSLKDRSLVELFYNDYYYHNFFEVDENDYEDKKIKLSYFYFKRLGVYAFDNLVSKKLVVFSRSFFQDLLEDEKDDNTYQNRRTYINDYYSCFKDGAKFNQDALINVYTVSDYEFLSFVDYFLSPDRVFRYKDVSIAISGISNELQKSLFHIIENIYLYGGDNKDKLFASFKEAVFSNVFKIIVSDTNKDLLDIVYSLKETDLLEHYLSLAPVINLKEFLINENGEPQTILELSREVASNRDANEIKRFTMLKNIKRIVKSQYKSEEDYQRTLSDADTYYDQILKERKRV